MELSRCRTYLAFLREARELAQKDSENFDALIHAFERIGSMEMGTVCGSLKDYGPKLLSIAAKSSLHAGRPSHLHIHAPRLLELIKHQRNDAMHQGVIARNLVRHSVEFCLILEHALTEEMKTVADLMVRNVSFAEMDHPVSYIRQQMLVNSFSYLPVLTGDDDIKLLSDAALAKWLRTKSWPERNEALATPLGEAIGGSPELLFAAIKRPSDTLVCELAKEIGAFPLLLHDPERKNKVVGLISAFDLL